MIVIKAASVVEVHLLGLSPNRSCVKFKGVNDYGSTDFSKFMLVKRRFIHLFNARKLK